MAYIKVDHSKFEDAASEIDEYVTYLRKQMREVQGEAWDLIQNWQGSDFVQFRAQLDKIDNSDSTHAQMIKALESYAKYLRYAGKKYRDTQASAVNRANSLPK
jgi:WXG100 family type VII secretion target